MKLIILSPLSIYYSLFTDQHSSSLSSAINLCHYISQWSNYSNCYLCITNCFLVSMKHWDMQIRKHKQMLWKLVLQVFYLIFKFSNLPWTVCIIIKTTKNKVCLWIVSAFKVKQVFKDKRQRNVVEELIWLYKLNILNF